MSDLVMVYSNGFCFVGEPVKDGLKDACLLMSVNVMSPQGLMPLTVTKKIGNLKMSLDCPRITVDTDNEIYREYVKLVRGIEIPQKHIH